MLCWMFLFFCNHRVNFKILYRRHDQVDNSRSNNSINIRPSPPPEPRPLPWPRAWPRQCPGRRWAACRMWRTRSQSPPEPWTQSYHLHELPHYKAHKAHQAHLCFPTIAANSSRRLATSLGCSMKLVVESITPGTSTYTVQYSTEQ